MNYLVQFKNTCSRVLNAWTFWHTSTGLLIMQLVSPNKLTAGKIAVIASARIHPAQIWDEDTSFDVEHECNLAPMRPQAINAQCLSIIAALR